MQNTQTEHKNGHGNLRGHRPAGRGPAKKDNLDPCPRCGERNEVVPILYGFPTHAAFLKADRGEIYLGGCEVSPYGFYCKRCDREF